MERISLDEIKLNQVKAGMKLSDLRKAAGSQGIDLGPEKRERHHVDFPDAKHKKDGSNARTKDGKVIGGSASGTKMTNNTHGAKLKDAVVAGHAKKVNQGSNPDVGYWKNPDNKAKRKADAAANKAAKKKRNDPFTRKRTFEEFITDCNNTLAEDYYYDTIVK